MKMKTLPPVKQPADCWDWITPEDVLRIALASFYATCRRTELMPEDGSPWLSEEDGEHYPYRDRLGFPGEVAWQFQHKLAEFAHQRGIGNFLDEVRELIEDERHIKQTPSWKPSVPSISGRPDIHCLANRLAERPA